MAYEVIDDTDYDDPFEKYEDDPCDCIGPCLYSNRLVHPSAEDRNLFLPALDEIENDMYYDDFVKYIGDPEDDDRNSVYDFGSYGQQNAVYFLKKGSGFGLDAVYGEGYRGYSVTKCP